MVGWHTHLDTIMCKTWKAKAWRWWRQERKSKGCWTELCVCIVWICII